MSERNIVNAALKVARKNSGKDKKKAKDLYEKLRDNYPDKDDLIYAIANHL